MNQSNVKKNNYIPTKELFLETLYYSVRDYKTTLSL